MYDIIIIGAGPAGLTAAIYGARALKKVVVFEALNYGGQIITTDKIDNYPALPGVSGYEFAENLYNQTKNLGAEIKFEKVTQITDGEIKEVTTNKGTYKGKTVIIATGCDNRKLRLENEERLTGRGVSYCATCDGALFKNKVVAVVGGGNTALEDALYLCDLASKVYLIHRRDEFRGEEALAEKLKNKNNLEFVFNSNVTKINGEEKLESVEVTDNNGMKKELAISGLFIAVGRVPENENFRKLINLNQAGYIEAKEDCHTNVEGIFVAGDVRVKSLRQLVTAEADGAVAAMEAIKYINRRKNV